MSTATHDAKAHAPARVLWSWSELRLAALITLWWLLPAGLVVGLKFVYADLFPPIPWMFLLFWSVLLYVPLYLLAWPPWLRVDGRGIWRRHFFREDPWPWEAFAAGAVRQGAGPYCWEYPDKPPRYRTISFDGLAEADRDWLTERVRQVWQPPALHLPDEIKIDARLQVRKYLELSGRIRIPALVLVNSCVGLSPGGIVVSQKTSGPSRHYAWSDVVQMRVTRFDHERRDFCELELDLAGLPAGEPAVALHGRPGGHPGNWDGPDAEVLFAYLMHYVGNDRVQFTARTGPPRTPDEADRRLRDLDRSERENRKAARTVAGVFLFICFLLVLAHGGVAQWDAAAWYGVGIVFLGASLTAAAIGRHLSAERLRVRRLRSELTSWVTRGPTA